jgi:hypothetical protein
VVTQYDDVALYPPAYFHPTVGESKSNPDAQQFLLHDSSPALGSRRIESGTSGCGSRTTVVEVPLQPKRKSHSCSRYPDLA